MQNIHPGNPQEDRLDAVVPVRPPAQDVKPQIDLGGRISADGEWSIVEGHGGCCCGSELSIAVVVGVGGEPLFRELVANRTTEQKDREHGNGSPIERAAAAIPAAGRFHPQRRPAIPVRTRSLR